MSHNSLRASGLQQGAWPAAQCPVLPPRRTAEEAWGGILIFSKGGGADGWG